MLACFFFFNHSLLFTHSINILHWNVLAKNFLFPFMFKTWTTVVWKYIVDAHRRKCSKMRWICHVHFKFKGILLIQSNRCGDGELGFSSACLPDLQRHNKMLEKLWKWTYRALILKYQIFIDKIHTQHLLKCYLLTVKTHFEILPGL